jgi:hypothetical protein
MDFTFGIITSQKNPLEYLNQTIDSIKKLNIPNYEIIIIGGDQDLCIDNINLYSFKEHPTMGWITKKKNLITQKAIYENIVYMHDYFYFDEKWYENFLLFGNDWKVCTNKLINIDGKRYRDWNLCQVLRTCKGNTRSISPYYLLPYDFKHLSKLMYISGGYWIAKKHVMEEFPLDEKLFHCQVEDIEWSWRIIKKYNFSLNEKSIVHLNKFHQVQFLEILPDTEIYNDFKILNESKLYHNSSDLMNKIENPQLPK